MEKIRKEQILILAKTYPSPSAQYVETSCVAGINRDGAMRRLYPVPFRMVEKGQQFRKWQWIEVRVEKANKDHRPESHKLYVDTITCAETITTAGQWAERRSWLDKIPTFDTLDELNIHRQKEGVSLAMLRPKKIISLEIVKARNQEWTKEEKEKLVREQMQGNLFSEHEAKHQIKELRKVPFDFYYKYVCCNGAEDIELRHKIVDWEAGALYWNCHRKHGPNWEAAFRKKLEEELRTKDLTFLMGNQHRFQDQWLIISLVYPPTRTPAETPQQSLF